MATARHPARQVKLDCDQQASRHGPTTSEPTDKQKSLSSLFRDCLRQLRGAGVRIPDAKGVLLQTFCGGDINGKRAPDS